jgi:hypothetical protein
MSVPLRRLASESRRAVNAGRLAEHAEKSKSILVPKWYKALKEARKHQTPVRPRKEFVQRKLRAPEAPLVREYFAKFPEAAHQPFNPRAGEAHPAQRFAQRQLQLMQSEGLSKRDAFARTLEEARAAADDASSGHTEQLRPYGQEIERFQQEEANVLEQAGVLSELSSSACEKADASDASAPESDAGGSRPRAPQRKRGEGKRASAKRSNNKRRGSRGRE